MPELWTLLNRSTSLLKPGGDIRFFSDTQVQAICASHKNGQSVIGLAQQWQCPPSRIRDLLREKGVIREPTAWAIRFSQDEAADICKQYARGVSLATLAAQRRSSPPTIARLLSDKGVTIRRVVPWHRLLSPAQTRKIFQQYKRGSSMAQLATEWGCSANTIWKLLKANGLNRNRGGRSRFTEAQVLRMVRHYQDGMRLREIASKFACSIEAVRLRMRRRRVPLRRPRKR